jgi:hypothetical protein
VTTPTPEPTGTDAGPAPTPRARTLLGIKIHETIVTGQKHIAWSSVFLISLIWFTWGFHNFAGGQALMFVVKRYNGDPRVISIVMTLNVIIMLGPFISYISDQVWTRLGRRRPFLIAAWTAACLAMFSFAFLPQVAGAINTALGAVGIPAIGEFALLIGIIVGYTTFYDLTAPLEPLFLECVPPHQRGRFWAIRGVLMSLAVLFFFQVLWPVYDEAVDLFGWLGRPGALVLQGSQLVFIFAGSMYLITGGFLLFNVREAKMPSAPNKRFRDLGVLKFMKNYFKDVFLTKANYPFYIVLVIPALETMVWGGFGALMQNDQFGYSKPNQALWAFPMQIMSMTLLTPFSGWYSDVRVNIRRWLRWVILAAALGAFAAAGFIYREWAPPEIRELPPVWVLAALTFLIGAGTSGVFVVAVESMLDRTGREHTRAWVSLLTVVIHVIVSVSLYVSIQTSADRVLPILTWMCFNVANATFGALLGTFVGPMIYEYMPRSKMGTINSGKGIYSDTLKFGIANLGAWWVWLYSSKVYHPPHCSYDYSSMYLIQFALIVPALIAKIFFIRQVVTGRIKKWGIIEVEGEEAAAKASTPPAPSK